MIKNFNDWLFENYVISSSDIKNSDMNGLYPDAVNEWIETRDADIVKIPKQKFEYHPTIQMYTGMIITLEYGNLFTNEFLDKIKKFRDQTLFQDQTTFPKGGGYGNFGANTLLTDYKLSGIVITEQTDGGINVLFNLEGLVSLIKEKLISPAILLELPKSPDNQYYSEKDLKDLKVSSLDEILHSFRGQLGGEKFNI